MDIDKIKDVFSELSKLSNEEFWDEAKAVSPRKFLSVHDAHCCSTHGCKYGDEDCPVILGIEPGIECEECYEDNYRAMVEDIELNRLRVENKILSQKLKKYVDKYGLLD